MIHTPKYNIIFSSPSYVKPTNLHSFCIYTSWTLNSSTFCHNQEDALLSGEDPKENSIFSLHLEISAPHSSLLPTFPWVLQIQMLPPSQWHLKNVEFLHWFPYLFPCLFKAFFHWLWLVRENSYLWWLERMHFHGGRWSWDYCARENGISWNNIPIRDDKSDQWR